MILSQQMLVFIVVAVIALLIVVLFFFLFRGGSARRLYGPIEELETFLEECKERLELLSPHAHDYFNSLGGEGARTYAHLTRILGAIEMRITAVEELISIGGSSAIAQAEEILASNYTFDTGTMSSILGEERIPDLPVDRVDMTVEKLFQDLGRRIATASSQSNLPRVPGRKRRDTLHSLSQAGIKVLSAESLNDEENEEEEEH